MRKRCSASRRSRLRRNPPPTATTTGPSSICSGAEVCGAGQLRLLGGSVCGGQELRGSDIQHALVVCIARSLHVVERERPGPDLVAASDIVDLAAALVVDLGSPLEHREARYVPPVGTCQLGAAGSTIGVALAVPR